MLGPELVFLIDVDNTLLDSDRFTADLSAYLTCDFGAHEQERYWRLHKARRQTLGYADYLGTLQEFRVGLENHPLLVNMSAFLLNYPFAQRLFPGALKALGHLSTLGTTVLFSDGDMVFQPRKIHNAGLWRAVAGRVLIPVHKELALAAMESRYPAEHYIMIDDKPLLLATMKLEMGERLTTVFVRQGHYAREAEALTLHPEPDIILEHIQDVTSFNLENFLPRAAVQQQQSRQVCR